MKNNKQILTKIYSIDDYLCNPSLYSVLSVLEYIKSVEDIDTINSILEVDHRKPVQTACNHKLNKHNQKQDSLLAISLHYLGKISREKLAKSLKSDAKYIDYIVSEYKASRDRNANLKRKQKPLIEPVIRLHNMKWSGNLNISPEIMIDGDLIKIIKLGLSK